MLFCCCLQTCNVQKRFVFLVCLFIHAFSRIYMKMLEKLEIFRTLHWINDSLMFMPIFQRLCLCSILKHKRVIEVINFFYQIYYENLLQ